MFLDTHFLFRPLTFDPLTAAETAIDMTLSMLLNHERASRLIVLKSRNNNQLGLDYMIKQLVNNTILKTNISLNGLKLETQKLVNYRVLNHMFYNNLNIFPKSIFLL